MAHFFKKAFFFLGLAAGCLAAQPAFGQEILRYRQIAELKVYVGDAGLGKGFQLAWWTMWDPKRVKREWPWYAYYADSMRELCRDEELVQKNRQLDRSFAIAVEREDRPPQTAYAAARLVPDSGGLLSLEQVCYFVEQPSWEPRMKTPEEAANAQMIKESYRRRGWIYPFPVKPPQASDSSWILVFAKPLAGIAADLRIQTPLEREWGSDF